MNLKKSTILSAAFFFSFTAFIYAQEGSQLISSVMYQDLDAVVKLVESEVDVNYQDPSYGSTALIMACTYNFDKIAKYLLDNGADANLQAKNGSTALIACAGVSMDLVKRLIANGADPNIKSADGTTAFTTSIVGVLMERVTTEVAELLLKNGADVNEASNTGRTEGYTCLMMASRNGNQDLVKFLVKNGADINTKAKDGSTAISLAEKKKNNAMVKLLKSLNEAGN